jgi:hypothetical protein
MTLDSVTICQTSHTRDKTENCTTTMNKEIFNFVLVPIMQTWVILQCEKTEYNKNEKNTQTSPLLRKHIKYLLHKGKPKLAAVFIHVHGLTNLTKLTKIIVKSYQTVEEASQFKITKTLNLVLSWWMLLLHKMPTTIMPQSIITTSQILGKPFSEVILPQATFVLQLWGQVTLAEYLHRYMPNIYGGSYMEP